ncbi:purine permease [Coprinopsis cinerea okayama7|uniref:Purine permease n=1 Tax=Coprinopsis cinerea (strain Okayama-7 / 130 / ATCC MYA-4618 / FGSC 9003) TaxID=240176 RepID=A8P657_COPC7|nr:purine permease [Coprinopsis cinerea okayama7\|eukprot:XP_001839088.2 purine permease [Coprinopsis cinerea okayama7\
MAAVDSQPQSISGPVVPSLPLGSRLDGVKGVVQRIKRKVTTKQGWIGDYDYAWLCTPSLPFMKRDNRLPPFYALDDSLPLLLGMTSGLQHALAMLAGLITPPIIFASSLNLDPELSAYMISASLIGCGFLSLLQMSRIHLFKGYYLGTGLLTVVGTSFATLSTANAVFNAMYNDGTCPSTVGPDGTFVRGPCPDAYGMVLGTALVCSFFEIFLSFCSPRILKRLFPPIVTGTVILMIGASLIGESGIANWGGGANNCKLRPETGLFALCPTINAPRPLPWGSAEFIGLGFLSFSTIILVEMFGSPFMRNISIICGLVVGCVVAGATGYMSDSTIKSAPAITFLWVHRFKLGVYPPAILPMLAVYVSLAMEAIGDITASAEVSKQPVVGPIFDSRIQGGVLCDGIAGLLSALFTVTPLSTFAQNNGVIAITRCANRGAGRWCCFFLILFGTIGKISGVFLAIPNSVLGGVTTFLFANVAVSGVRVLAASGTFGRRDRFVLGAALSFGVGNLLSHDIFTHLFERVDNPGKGLKGLFDSITIVLSTPFLSAGVVATVLNLVLPHEPEEPTPVVDDSSSVDVERVDVEGQTEKSSKAY